MKTDFEGGEGNAENNILDQLKRRLNIILFGTTKPEEDQKIKLGKNDLLSASNVVFFDELLKTDVGDPTTSRELNKSFMSYMAIASFNASIRRFFEFVNIYFTYLHKKI